MHKHVNNTTCIPSAAVAAAASAVPVEGLSAVSNDNCMRCFVASTATTFAFTAWPSKYAHDSAVPIFCDGHQHHINNTSRSHQQTRQTTQQTSQQHHLMYANHNNATQNST
jgi:hypothetical protein